MTKAKYPTPEARRLAMSLKAKAQMIAQWERYRQQTGQVLGYFGGHRRVRKTRGPAKYQKCIECSAQAQHWALIHGKNGEKPEHYQAMCQKCHWAYDEVGRRAKEAMTPEARSALAYRAWETKRQKRGANDNS